MFACNLKTRKRTDESQVFWGLFLHCRWLICCCGHTWLIATPRVCVSRHSDVSCIPYNGTVTRIAGFNLTGRGSLSTDASGTPKCLRRMENLELWPDLQISLILIQWSIHRIQRNPKTSSQNSPGISLLSSSQMLMKNKKRTAGKNRDRVTICLVLFTTRMHGYNLLLRDPPKKSYFEFLDARLTPKAPFSICHADEKSSVQADLHCE